MHRRTDGASIICWRVGIKKIRYTWKKTADERLVKTIDGNNSVMNQIRRFIMRLVLKTLLLMVENSRFIHYTGWLEVLKPKWDCFLNCK